MKLLFVHDHRFLHGPEGEFYTQGSFPSAIWPRYLEFFESLTVIARDEGAYSDEGLARSDRAGVHFRLVKSPSYPERLGLLRGPAFAAIHEEMSRCDAVIVRLPSDLGLLAAREAVRRSVPLMIEVVGCASDGYGNQGSLAARLYAPFAAWRMRRAVARAGFSLYVTDRWLQGRYPPGTHTRTAAVSDVNIEQASPAQRAKRERRLADIANGGVPVMGTVASLRTRSKGIQTMLEALRRMREGSGVDVEYRVLGPGDPEPWHRLCAELGISDLVKFDGSRPAGQAVLEWLDGIDIHAQPSFQEGLPRATIEAMSRGCCCLGSTAGGIPELIPDERLHAPGDVEGIVRILSRTLARPEEIESGSRQGYEGSLRYEFARVERSRRAFFSEFADEAAGRRSGTARSTA